MGRRAKSPKAKRPLARESPPDEGGARVRDLEKRLAESLEREKAKDRALTDALEQQTATSEILHAISRTQTDAQPVFQIIAESARCLCAASRGTVFLYDGERIHVAALDNFGPEAADEIRRAFPMRPDEDRATGRALRTRAIVQISDVLEDHASASLRSEAQTGGFRSVMAVPMLRDGEPIGLIVVGRPTPGRFSDKQVNLLQTFADQAVIAIENVRLFNETKEALEQQTATSEILRVISSSPTDLQPVFDAIASRVGRLCDAFFSTVWRYDGSLIHHAADNYPTEEMRAILTRGYPAPPRRESAVAQAISECRIIHVDDLLDDSAPVASRDVAIALGYRTVLCVPMLRDGVSIGALAVARREQRSFSDRQIELVKTFADQAVIAIENVRLFTELQQRNRAVTEALEQQTATSELLKVIGRATFDLQPVFDALAENAVRLCEAERAFVYRFDGQLLRLVVAHNASPRLTAFIEAHPFTPGHANSAARAALERRTTHIHDAQADPAYDYGTLDIDPIHTVLSIPILQGPKELLGVITIYRLEIRPFSDSQISLMETFADQAAIAIENARLLTELQARTAELTRSVDELTALGDVGRVLSSTLDLETVLQTIVTRATQLTGTAGCTIWEYDEAREEFRLRVSHYADAADATVPQALGRVTTMRKGQGVTTQVVERRQPVQIRDIAVEGTYESPIRLPLIEAGHRALLGVPLLSEDEVIGVLEVTRKTPGEFEPEIVRLLSTFATQSALAIQNARLFLEIEDKSRQLAAASQHKSEFLANMSHELRTPLNAIIGFSEVLTERMFGELNEKQDEYLKDIYASGQHLLSLINDILDLSKIEAGRMELEPADFDLVGALDNALTLVRERAGRRGITLGREIDGRIGMIRGDERKVKQVLLNLLSNALKFTPEGGRIDVRATVSDGMVEVSVADTGVGIAHEDQEAVFQEFRQVGTADKKVEGTGLGLALSRKFIELHGGRIWVQSELGHGSTFAFTLPVRAGE